MRGHAFDPGEPRGGASTARVRSWRATLCGIVRVSLLLSAILFAMLAAWLRSAEARAGEALLGFGAELFEWQDARFHTKPRRLSLNGLELRLVTASTDLSVKDVLDRFEGLCRRKGGVAIPDGVKLALPGTVLEGFVRRGSERQGVIACIDTGGPLDVLDLAPRIDRFATTGNLGELGDLRYVMARQSGKTTTVVAFWTEGGAPILKMFPKTGDAPGRDPKGVPRPENVRRLLFAAEHGAPYSLALYGADAWKPEALFDWYVRALGEGGWSVDRVATDNAAIARKGARTLAIKVSRTSSGQTVASVTELS